VLIHEPQKPDCIACTESKQTVELFDKSTEWKTEPGKLTRVDLAPKRIQEYLTHLKTQG
jgi:hypothetical protein